MDRIMLVQSYERSVGYESYALQAVRRGQRPISTRINATRSLDDGSYMINATRSLDDGSYMINATRSLDDGSYI
jgi:hypothetical protein